jgi:PhnB protein
VADAESFVRFLMQGLGGTDTCRTMRSNRLIQNVQVRLGTTTVMVSEATERYKPMTAACYRDVEDADASMQRALKQRQHAIQQEPERRFLEKWLAELGRATGSP